MTYVFGKSISRKFYPLLDNEPVLLPSQVPSIWLYSSQPSLAEAQSGANRIATYDVSYWEESAPYERTYTINSIPDPEPTGSTKARGYWEVVRFVAQSSQQTQTSIRFFEVERLEETDTTPETSVQTLKNLCPQCADYFSDPELEQYIDNSIELVRLELEGKGMSWGDLFNLHKLTKAVAYRALMDAWSNQIQLEGDRFFIWASQYREGYKVAMSSITIGLDTDGDNKPDAVGSAQPQYRIFER